MSFEGMRVLALESRRAAEMAELIRKQGGEPLVAPSMREAPIEQNHEAFAFTGRLFAGGFDMMVLMTGVGTRALHNVVATRYPPERFIEALRGITLVARGPKPAAVLREMGLRPGLTAPEPNTWREVLAVTEGRPERRIAVQEYGRPNPELIDAFRARGAEVTPVRVYQYALPEDTGPLRRAAERVAAGEVHVALFTTAMQVHHLLRVAREAGMEAEVLQGLRKAAIGSVGPTTTESIEECGLKPDFEPSHPKMGLLVNEMAAWHATRAGAAGSRPGAGE